MCKVREWRSAEGVMLKRHIPCKDVSIKEGKSAEAVNLLYFQSCVDGRWYLK